MWSNTLPLNRDALGSLEPTRLKKKTVRKIYDNPPKRETRTVALVMSFSRTGNIASGVINKHLKILQPELYRTPSI